MEDRKKLIRDLEAKKAETQGILDELLENLGESLLIRFENDEIKPGLPPPPAEGDHPAALREEKAVLVREIANSRTSIKAIERNLSRLGDLETIISQKERLLSEKNKEANNLNAELGNLILDDYHFDDFCAPYKNQLHDILFRIDFQKKKLEEIESQEGGFFSQIANGVKKMLSKSLIAKDQNALEKLYRNVGEQFFSLRERRLNDSQESSANAVDIQADGIIAELIKNGDELRVFQKTVRDEIAGFKSERRDTADSLDKGGDPVRRISDLEKYISRIEDDIGKIYRRFGICIRGAEQKNVFAGFFNDGDKILDEKIDALEALILDTDKRIAKTKIAIAIDNEKSEIAKLKDSIESKRRMIADANNDISNMENKINSAEKNIEELQEKHDQIN